MRVRAPAGKCASRLRIGAGIPPPWAHSEPSSSVSSSASSRVAIDGRAAGEHLVRAAQPDPAGKALAAALGGAEVQQVRGERAHVGRLVEGDDPAVAEHAADRREVVEVKRRVEQRRRQDPAERAADLQRLDRVAVDRPPATSSHSSRIVVPKRDLVDAGPREALVEADELRAGRRAVRAERARRRRRPARATSGMLHSVSTLLTTVGIPCSPRWAGNGGRAETVPRRPCRQASSAVSSPTT